MKVQCPTCNGVIPGEDIDLAGRVAVCRPCSEVFPLSVSHGGMALAARPPSELALPVDLRWSEVTEGATFQGEIVRSRAQALPTLVFAVFWNTIVIGMLVTFLLSAHPVSAVFLTLHVLAGLYVLYSGFCQLVNRTRFSLGPEGFAFLRGPLPELGTMALSLDETAGFTAVERGGSSRNARGRWTVAVQTRDGRSVPLRLQLSGADQAEYVASRLRHAIETVRPPEGYRGRR